MLEGAIGEGPFIRGANLTLADIALGPLIHRWFEMPIKRAELPKLARWYERARQRLAFMRHVGFGLS